LQEHPVDLVSPGKPAKNMEEVVAQVLADKADFSDVTFNLSTVETLDSVENIGLSDVALAEVSTMESMIAHAVEEAFAESKIQDEAETENTEVEHGNIVSMTQVTEAVTANEGVPEDDARYGSDVSMTHVSVSDKDKVAKGDESESKETKDDSIDAVAKDLSDVSLDINENDEVTAEVEDEDEVEAIDNNDLSAEGNDDEN